MAYVLYSLVPSLPATAATKAGAGETGNEAMCYIDMCNVLEYNYMVLYVHVHVYTSICLLFPPGSCPGEEPDHTEPPTVLCGGGCSGKGWKAPSGHQAAPSGPCYLLPPAW